MNRTAQQDPAAPAKAAPRREWTTPAIKRLTAAGAEFNVGATDDGPDFS